MPACPYGSHRLVLDEHLRCRHCGEDLRLYAALRDLPVTFYNEARRLWEASELWAAEAWLHAALELREDFAEAHWLLAAVEDGLGRPETARSRLARARDLGADVDPEWIPLPSQEEVETS
jgi:tetratricopeptide (TPR) repeat protein